jgi:AcrR family transcriptional regulator
VQVFFQRAMREEKIAQSKPKQRLLEATEKLIAERGFDAVSVRDITRLAGANVAAVNYHFGDRENLLDLVTTRHLEPVLEERLARLEHVEKKWSGKMIPLEEVLEALARPLVGPGRRSTLTGPPYRKLLGRVFSLHPDAYPAGLAQQLQQAAARFTRALGKCLPTVPAEELVWRMHFTTGAMVHLLLFEELPPHAGKTDGVGTGIEAALGRFIRFAAAGLREGVDAEIEKPKGPQATFDF